MRIRRKKWARPELDACNYYIDNAEEMRGKWHQAFADNSRPLYLELGCGKGVFAAQHALKSRHQHNRCGYQGGYAGCGQAHH